MEPGAPKHDVVFKGPLYHLKGGDHTPYCTHCWKEHKQAVNLVIQFDNEEGIRWDCPSCKQVYLIKNAESGWHRIRSFFRHWGR